QESWGTISRLKLISQNWRGFTWQHHLILVTPKEIRHPETAFLMISGDGNGDKKLTMLRTLTEQAGAPAAVLMNVPNQPLYDDRREDALIAYTFNQYMESGDESWPLLFPMVKSATRAMDALQQYMQQQNNQQITQFVVSGASKRGWTTWLTAAVDKRVNAIAPMVIDVLNMKQQLQWSEQVYGQQSVKIKDYTELNLHQKQDNPEMKKLRSWVDPYAYRHRFTMPKLLLLGTNDPYWTVDSLRHYWHDLPEPKLIYQTPNAGHNLKGGKQAIQTLAAFFEMIVEKTPLPKLSWQFQKESNQQVRLQLESNQTAKSINLWTALSKSRDFRKAQWTSEKLLTQGLLNIKLDTPDSAYKAYLMEVELETPSGHPYKLSTEARVTPDTKPCDCWHTDKTAQLD
ncbi:MAG: PhoPQ-activated pathogenicity-like protein PqaA type, partial [Methylococcaceae bacterium]|nr:PhoPQ-activated pathogenicity-like protein PqaA type [Methylococcaceae bacterium]